jgi:hypothetical protein
MLWLAENTIQTGNQIANTASEAAFASVVPIIWNNADTGSNAGRSFRIKAYGYYSCIAGTPGTLSLRIKIGSVYLHPTAPYPSISLPTGGVTNQGWTLGAYSQIVSTGSSGKMSFQGEALFNNGGTPIMMDFINLAGSPPASPWGQIIVNTQTASNLSLAVAFSVANASNSITLTQLICEEIG